MLCSSTELLPSGDWKLFPEGFLGLSLSPVDQQNLYRFSLGGRAKKESKLWQCLPLARFDRDRQADRMLKCGSKCTQKTGLREKSKDKFAEMPALPAWGFRVQDKWWKIRHFLRDFQTSVVSVRGKNVSCRKCISLSRILDDLADQGTKSPM